MVKRYQNEYYLVSETDPEKRVLLSELTLGIHLPNLAHMYTITALFPYRHNNIFEFKINDILKEILDVKIDYFEVLFVFMKREEIERYQQHVGLIKLWKKI